MYDMHVYNTRSFVWPVPHLSADVWVLCAICVGDHSVARYYYRCLYCSGGITLLMFASLVINITINAVNFMFDMPI